MHKLALQPAEFPDYTLFRSVRTSGLSQVRPPLDAAAASDPFGWNYGSGFPPSYWAYGRLRALLALLEAASLKPQSALEVAAGDAALSACLATMGCRVVANDLRGDNLSEAVANFSNGEAIQRLPGNLFDLDPATTGLFDLVIACEVLEHVAHTVDFLKQLRRFVAPGGHLLITTPNGSYFRNKLPTYSQVKDFDALEQQQFKPDADGHLFLITPDELRSVAQEAGLGVERMVVWGTPLVTGHVRLASLSSRAACRFCYQLESLAQKLPFAIKQKACFSISAILSPTR